MNNKQLRKKLQNLKNWSYRIFQGETSETGEIVKGLIFFTDRGLPMIQTKPKTNSFAIVRVSTVKEVDSCEQCSIKPLKGDYINIKCVSCQKNNIHFLETGNYFQKGESEE